MNSSLLSLWRAWDYIYYHTTRLQYVDKNHNLFRIVLLPFWDDSLVTKNGSTINRHDLVLKLHIHNFRLAEMIYMRKDSKALGIILLREVRKSMPGLARFIAKHPDANQISGVVGTTFLHRGVENLGFSTTCPIESNIYKIKSVYLKWMLRLMHPDGRNRLHKKSDKLTIKRVFISKNELLDRYLE